MHHRAHHIQHYHHNNYRNSELFRKSSEDKKKHPSFCAEFFKIKWKNSNLLSKSWLFGVGFAEEMKKETPSFSANLTVGLFVYLKRKTYEREKKWRKKIKTEENCCSQLFQILLRLFFDFVKNSVILATLLLKLLSTTLHTT